MIFLISLGALRFPKVSAENPGPSLRKEPFPLCGGKESASVSVGPPEGEEQEVLLDCVA